MRERESEECSIVRNLLGRVIIQQLSSMTSVWVWLATPIKHVLLFGQFMVYFVLCFNDKMINLVYL